MHCLFFLYLYMMNKLLKTSTKKQFKTDVTNSLKISDRTISFHHIAPFVPLPATILGICTMIYFDVPTFVWLLNLTFVCVGTFTAFLFIKNPIRLGKINPVIVSVVSIILLLGTFYNDGIMNVHRWINFKSLQINVGLIVSPLLLIQITRITNPILAILFCVITTIIFLLQPDASLVTAFSFSICFLLFRRYRNKLINLTYLFFTLCMIAYSWVQIR